MSIDRETRPNAVSGLGRDSFTVKVYLAISVGWRSGWPWASATEVLVAMQQVDDAHVAMSRLAGKSDEM